MIIDYSPEFKRLFKKLSLEIKKEAVEKEKIFRLDNFSKNLKVHKLSGKLKGRWAFSISYTHRIIFSFVNKEYVIFHAIGTHDIYK